MRLVKNGLNGWPLCFRRTQELVRKLSFIQQTRGATAINITLTLFLLIGGASLVIDMGHLYTIRNQLQNVADATALAGVSKLIESQGGQAVRNSEPAKQAAMQVAQSQSQIDEFAPVADGAQDDLTIHFGVWDLNVADRSLAWTDLGTSCASDSNANAIRVTIRRSAGTVFGPVTKLFARIFGFPTSDVSASATAYLGYTSEVQTGGIQVPLALPAMLIPAYRDLWCHSQVGEVVTNREQNAAWN
jgi:Flp pilus assembly protein TadG